MIRTQKDKLYTGITTDPDRRFYEHQQGQVGAKFFRSDRPLEIVYIEFFDSRSEASKREWELKQLRRSQKLELIAQSSSASGSKTQPSSEPC